MIPFLRNLIGICVLATALVSCVAASQRADSNGQAGADEIMLVGKIELNPPLGKYEQDFSGTIGLNRHRNSIAFYLGDAVVVPGVRHYEGKIKRSHLVKLGDDFYIKSKRSNPLFYSAPFIQLSASLHGVMRFPGVLRVEVPPEAKAVYIGTIRYHRNEYLEITKVELIDEFPRVQKEFSGRHGDMVLSRPKTSFINE